MAQKYIPSVAVLLFITLSCVFLAQDDAPKVHRLNLDVDLVLVNATVTESARNRPVRGLDEKDFQVWEDKVEQKISYFSSEDVPVSVGIIFDVSGSMKDKITSAQRAAATFFKSGTKQDEYFEVQFADRPRITSEFTSDVTKLQNSLLLVPTKGSTALYDAVYLGLNKLKESNNPKRALLLITDGEDNRSRYSFGDVRSFIREQDVQLYAIGILDPATGAGRDALAQLTDITGGTAFFPDSAFYVKQDYGQRTFTGQGAPITVVAGGVLKDINMSMTQAGNISGHLRDTSGAPLTGSPVQLLRATYNAAGQRSFQSVISDRTDDRGEYRLYWLSPGRYYLNAGTPPGPTNRPAALGGFGASPNQMPGESFAFSYYPGVTNISQAVAIDLSAGAEVSGIDFAVSRQQQLNVRGKVVDTRTGAPPAAVNISLAYQVFDSGGSFGGVSNYNASTGTFELTNITPGPYTITATVQDNSGANDPVSRARLASAAVPVEVFNSDVENVVLNLVPGFSISGKVRVEGKPLPLTATRFQLRRSQNGVISNLIGTSTPASVAADVDGVFRVEGVHPGEFRVSMSLPVEYYVKEVRFNQIDALNQPIQFQASDSAILDVVVASGAVQIDGTVFDTKSMPEAGVTVVLIPDQHRDRIDLYKNTPTDAKGRFTLRGVAPGDYKLFAWEALDPFAWFDPDTLSRDENKGKPIHVTDASNQSADLRVITPQ